MSTCLAEQLQRLAVPQTDRIRQDKKRASLLFDPKEAANLTKETVYQIGLDGLEELKERNVKFGDFEKTIFHVTSKHFERSVETVESNQKLDKNIRKFLQMLTPHFLFNCSYNALEWLVHRYSIHEYNKEDLLMLILPYHETNIFVRILQLFNLKSASDKWGWLQPLQKSGVHLPKSTLYKNASSNTYLLERISSYILNIINEHDNTRSLTTVFNFYCSTFVGALEYCDKVNEAHISQMLPALLTGLSSNIPDFVASSYVVCAQLLAKTDLSDKILNKLIEKICHISVDNLKSEAVLLLIVLFQTQKHKTTINETAIKKLVRRYGISKTLEKFNKNNMNIYPLLNPILVTSVQMILPNVDSEIYKKFVCEIFDEIKLENSFIPTLLTSCLEVCHPKLKYPKENVYWLKDFLNKIERQYPTAFDDAIKETLKTSTKPTKVQQILHKLYGDVSNIHSVYDLMEKMYHSNSKQRVGALHTLHKNLHLFREKDVKMVENAIFDRINDDSVAVVVETLKMFESKFPDVVDMERLKNMLLKLLTKCRNDKKHWWTILPIVLNVVFEYYDDCDVTVFISVLPFLLPTTADELEIAKSIVSNENFACKYRLLSSITSTPYNLEDYAQFTTVVCDNLKCAPLPDATILITSLKEMPEFRTDSFHKHLSLLVLCYSLPPVINFSAASSVLDIFELYLSKRVVVSKNAKTTLDQISLSKKNKFTLQCLLNCLEELISKLPDSSKINLTRMDFTCTNESVSFVLRILKILLPGVHSAKSIKSKLYVSTLKTVSKRFCRNEDAVVGFLLNATTGENDLIDDDLRILCAKTIKIFSVRTFSDPLLVVYALSALYTPDVQLRKILIEFLNADETVNRDEFLNRLLSYSDEILMDQEQLFTAFNSIFDAKKSDENLITFFDKLAGFLVEGLPIYFEATLITLIVNLNNSDWYLKTCAIANRVLENDKEKSKANVAESKIIEKNVVGLNKYVAKRLKQDSEAWKFITLCTRNDKLAVITSDDKLTCPSALLLEHIDREMFSCIPQDIQIQFLDLIIEVTSNSENTEVCQAAGHVFKRIDLDSLLVLNQLQKMRDVRSPTENPAKLKRRVDVVPTTDILDTNNWKKGVAVLEFVQDKKKIRNANCLLSVLFEILKKCLEFEEQANVEYPKQLLLSTILHCCQKIDTQHVSESVVNMQSVVQCIRASQNPQTHHHALLLLAEMAFLIPKQVLHHIIAIFTFMGSSVLRHDDEYSFQIITKIIDTVIPILIKDGKTESISHVLRVFVDAILDIPEHRRMRLFKQLLTKLEPTEHLWLFLAIVFEAQVVHGHSERQKTNRNRSFVGANEAPKRLDIAADLCREFAPKIVIATCIKVLQYLCKLPDEKNPDTVNVDKYTFDVQRYPPKQLRHYKYIVISFISNLLGSTHFVRQTAALTDDDMLQLEHLFKEAIVAVLNYIQMATKSAEISVNTPQAQYWKVILHYSCDTLDAINALLTEKMFLLVIRGLMVYSLCGIRKRALDLLNHKLQHNSALTNDCGKEQLFDLIVTPLVNIVKTIEEPDVDADQEQVVQKALVSLKLLVKRLAADNPHDFVPILDFATNLVATRFRKINDNVLASLILCVAELCDTLKARAIAGFSKCVPVILKLMKPGKENVPTLLLTSVVAATYKILDKLALFLSPFLKQLIRNVSIISARWNSNDDPKLSMFLAKLHGIQHKIGQTIPLRVLLPVIEESYSDLVTKTQYNAIEPLMKILCENLSILKGNDIQGHLTDLTGFFLKALQFRTTNSCNNVDEIEDTVIKAIGNLILKMSETTFRPLYYKIYDWAVRNNVKTDRIITFYNLSYVFANSLKGLFCLFAGHFINNAAALLDNCNNFKCNQLYFDDEQKNIILAENILKTLSTIFIYDTQKFVNKERFEVLMRPIVDQLENTVGGVDKLQTRANLIIIPCLVNFSIATADDALWKQTNYQILLKTRHNDPKIRLIALKCLGEIAKKLGEDFLPLLPETIPFLAELLEDEDEMVEKSCQRILQDLEKVLGEPLQKYF